jgi:hypothetical protein
MESVANDFSRIGFPRQWAFPVWAAETLHYFMDHIHNGADRLELSLKLYQMRNLRSRHQQLMARAPKFH